MEAAELENELVDSNFAANGSVFPNEFVNPRVKQHPKYGVMYAKAMHYATGRFGGTSSFWNDEEFQALLEIAQGRQSVENIRKMFGYFKDSNEDPKDDGSANLAFLDVKVLNLAPKYINRAVQKIINREYTVQLEAIDPVSVHEKETYEANIRTYYEFKQWLLDIKMNPRDFFPDLDVDVLPEYPDELMYEMLTNPKIQKSVDGELSLTLIQEMNDFNQKMRMAAWDKVVYGRGHMHVFRDRNGMPRVEKINPKFYIGSYVEDENFQHQEYAGFYDFPTVNEFRKEAAGTMPDYMIEEVVKKYAYQNNIENSYNPSRDNQKFDGLNYIPVMRFYFLSQDDRVYIKRKNQFGNHTLMERSLDFVPSKGDDEVIKNSYTSVYGGCWVLDTDYVYDYGLKSYPRSNLVDVTLPIITFAPNYKDGRTVSFASQMIEPLFMINVAWNKIKEILAKGWMGYQEIDFTQLESVALGKGGQTWKPRAVYKHFLQTNRLVKRSPVNKHDQRYSSSAIESNSGGLLLADYFTAFTTGINMLEQMTATTVAESVKTPDRLAVGVMEQSQATGDLDMGYLFNAYEWMYKSVCHHLLLLTQEAKRDGIGIAGFISSLGQHFSVPDTLPYCDYGLFLTKAPGPQEWAEFYAQLSIGLEKGTLTHLDTAYIREIKNLKKARQILGQRIKINERKAMQMNQQNQQAAIDANTSATQNKMQADIQTLQIEGQIKSEQIILQGKINESLMVREKELDGLLQGQEGQVKKAIAKQTSVDEIIKQSVRNKGELEKEMMKPKPDTSKPKKK